MDWGDGERVLPCDVRGVASAVGSKVEAEESKALSLSASFD